MYYLKRLIHFVTVFIVSLTIPSCKNLSDENRFIGNWQYSETRNADNIVYNTTRTIQLTKKTWEETFVIRRDSSGIISGITGTRGKLILTHSGLIFEVAELGTCTRDISDACTDQVSWYGEGSAYWTENIPFFQLIIKGEFQADDVTLHLTRDLNNDGDTEDPGENVEFVRI